MLVALAKTNSNTATNLASFIHVDDDRGGCGVNLFGFGQLWLIEKGFLYFWRHQVDP